MKKVLSLGLLILFIFSNPCNLRVHAGRKKRYYLVCKHGSLMWEKGPFSVRNLAKHEQLIGAGCYDILEFQEYSDGEDWYSDDEIGNYKKEQSCYLL